MIPPTPALALDQESLTALWSETCLQLTESISPLVVNTWGKTCTLHQIETFDADRKWLCTFLCPSSFNALQFEKNLKTPVATALAAKLGRPVELKFIFNLPHPTTPTPEPVSPISAPLTTSPPPSKPKPQPTDYNDGLFSSRTVQQTIISRAQVVAKHLGLRPDFTFDTFAISGSNEMAHVAALSVAKNPGVSYNPLFLYGAVGVGKTHLMQSIGNYILAHRPETKIIYCTGEEFTNSIIKAIQTKQALNFKDEYRHCEVLLIDDIQFIAGKNAVQEEFFHTFNALAKQNHQIVLTSDRPPHEIALLEDRLRSRFEAGLKIDIQQPSFELRSAILLSKATAANLELPMELAQTIASRVDSARQLEGIIMRLKSEVELKGATITADLVADILSEHDRQQFSSRQLHPREILNTVASHYHLKPAVLTGTKRQKEITLARHVAMFLLKSNLSMSYGEIGHLFSNRDHTSVMHAVNKINSRLDKDQLLASDLQQIKSRLFHV